MVRKSSAIQAPIANGNEGSNPSRGTAHHKVCTITKSPLEVIKYDHC